MVVQRDFKEVTRNIIFML